MFQLFRYTGFVQAYDISENVQVQTCTLSISSTDVLILNLVTPLFPSLSSNNMQTWNTAMFCDLNPETQL